MERLIFSEEGGKRDNFGIISLFFHKNIHCDPTLEPSHGDSSNKGSQYMFSFRIRSIITLILS